MNASGTILQIVPRVPGGLDGVGDYALTLAKRLSEDHGAGSVFAAQEVAHATAPDDFEAVALSNLREFFTAGSPRVILHYVNYGYHERGVPFGLVTILRELRRQPESFILTIFHELYASAPPWTSAFWLRPLQVGVARAIARLSDACITSNETMLAQLRSLAPRARVAVQPVTSNFGEPALAQTDIAARSPHDWVICGGTALIERSARSFRAIAASIPERFAPRRLFVVGGQDNQSVRTLTAGLANVTVEYRPQVDACDASQILSRCSFAWLDYFRRTDVRSDVLLKSTAFAAACAHGVIPVLPHPGSPISVEGDSLPGPFFVADGSSHLPDEADRGNLAVEFYEWYERRATSRRLAAAVAEMMNQPGSGE